MKPTAGPMEVTASRMPEKQPKQSTGCSVFLIQIKLYHICYILGKTTHILHLIIVQNYTLYTYTFLSQLITLNRFLTFP